MESTDSKPPSSCKSKIPHINRLEQKLLAFSGLELNKSLYIYDVPIYINDKLHLIHTYRCGDFKDEVLVLLHGFGGSSALYYNMLKDLSEHYQVYCIDFVGMGLSSKQKFECKSTEETLDFFLGSIEKWRKVIRLEKFHLAGHSFGGYISAHYALKHPEQVTKLSLLSPVGVTRGIKELNVEERAAQMGFWQRQFFTWAMNNWKKGETPHSILRSFSFVGKFLVKKQLKRLFSVEKEQEEPLGEYMAEMLSLPIGSEPAIHHIIKGPNLEAFLPLEDFLEELKMPVDCYYGQHDYMSSTGANRVARRQKKLDFAIEIVPDAAHQLPMNNPVYLSAILIERRNKGQKKRR